MPPSTTATTKEVVGDDKQQEGVNWAATVAGVMVILVLAFGAFIGAIYVWFLVLKKQNPNLKVCTPIWSRNDSSVLFLIRTLYASGMCGHV